MFTQRPAPLDFGPSEKDIDWTIKSDDDHRLSNPVIASAQHVHEKTELVSLNPEGIKSAARYIHDKLIADTYSPHTWRTHPLHLCPPLHFSAADPRTRATLDWIFLVSALNFSFWSEREGRADRYGVEWREGWGLGGHTVWTGYWSLLAALNRAIEAGIPITDPAFYSSEVLCPDNLIEDIFRPAAQSKETIPLLKERILIMREVGSTLCSSYGGSFQGFMNEFQGRHHQSGTALQLVYMITDTFPSFRDETWCEGRQVFFWKRAQILVAETWAAFYPPPPSNPRMPQIQHPFFPSGIHELTMFADYRVPQILHHLLIITYPPSLLELLHAHAPFASGSREEMSIRAASIIAVEAIRDEILKMRGTALDGTVGGTGEGVSSVLIDFYLWDLAKALERGEQRIEGIETGEMVPSHRTRSIWY